LVIFFACRVTTPHNYKMDMSERPHEMNGQKKQSSFLSITLDMNPITLLVFATIAIIGTAAISHSFSIKNVWSHGVLTSVIFSLCLIGYKQFFARKSLKKNLQGLAPAESQQKGRRNLEVAIAEGLQEAIFIVDRNAIITYFNQAARRLFPDLTVRCPLSNYVRDPDISLLVTETLAGKAATPKSIVRPGSVDRHLRVSGAPIITERYGEETIRRAVIIFADVTEIERTNTQRADFLANASHELKTPIASMIGYIETLRGHAKDDPEAQKMFLGIMQEQAERMQRLITDILSLRKIELSEHLVPTERADFGLAAKAALEAVHPIAEVRKVRVKFSGKKKSALVMGRQDELVQLTLNLVDNAVRMSPPESDVQLMIDRLDNWMPGLQFTDNPIAKNAPRRRIVTPPRAGVPYWRLTIRDSGPGFDRDHLPRLGERFYRIAGDRSSKEKGTGLGLAIVKHIVRWHRGGLYIESQEGVGTEFTIIMPVAPSLDINDDMTEPHKLANPETLTNK